MLAALQKHIINYLSSSEPTYWPTDRKKLPKLIDFLLLIDINPKPFRVISCHELAGNHYLIIITLSSHFTEKETRPTLYTKNKQTENISEKIWKNI